jgi:predicted nucleic acid-binding protein
MLVASNTSPLIAIACIGRLNLVREYCGEVLIPSQVRDELKTESVRPGAQTLDKAISDGWLKVSSHLRTDVFRALCAEIHEGEAAAIALAVHLNVDLLLLDERDARKAAASWEIEVTGAVGILLWAKLNGKIPSLKNDRALLRKKVGFRLSPEIEDKALRSVGELSQPGK